MNWFARFFKSQSDEQGHESISEIAAEIANAAAACTTPLEQTAAETSNLVSVLARTKLKERNWSVRDVDAFFEEFATRLAIAGVSADRVRVIAALARETTRADIASGKPLPKTRLSEYMDHRDRSRWDFSAHARQRSRELLGVFAHLEEVLSETEWALGLANGCDNETKQRIAAGVRRLVLQYAAEPKAHDYLWALDSQMRNEENVLHMAPYIARLVLNAAEIVQPATRQPEDEIALMLLMMGGKEALRRGQPLTPVAIARYQQSVVGWFLTANGQRGWLGSAVFPTEFVAANATEAAQG
jgi:hypothetical protein